MADSPDPTIPQRSAPGGARAVLEASAAAAARGDPAALAVVLETQGSTYVRPAAMALFGARGGQVGWLSGGCIEPEIELRAQEVALSQGIDWLEIDTRHDEDLFAGSAVGCRGRLRLALLPLAGLRDWPVLVDEWRRGHGDLRLEIRGDGALRAAVGDERLRWTLPVNTPPWAGGATAAWSLEIAAPPSVLVLGAGPETPALLPLLRTLGWMTSLVERRPRWAGLAALADHAIERSPAQALAVTRPHDAAVVMHHHFELDREALEHLGDSPGGQAIGFVGLLGPAARRDDLFRVLPASARDSLRPRLHAPIGLPLGGHGPEAIALSVAAQLQRHRHGGD
ncbi:XdhC family protein [Lysobacter sp. BMK333-48F3]|uniref:XdhC family protein n=1 Tax=Lysobacter sp. BMK333-48F3 TaxID=2867962 RepID=UPI001C8BB0CD|nr:XdhC/CoxI family protein [Lysobacter sp. BMK333-48F3]MBX9400424.1 XdhC family protein [Lysobacter sp. BMK333-48F3]